MKRIFPTVFILGISANALADETLWLYAKGTDTRPKASYELKVSEISRIGKSSGSYQMHDIRPEIEYGITDKLTATAEAIVFKHNYKVDDPELQPMFDTQTEAGGRFNKTQFGGYEIGLKYNIASPYTQKVGYSTGFSYEKRDRYRLDGAKIDQDSFVFTQFFQTNFLDDALVLALTPKIEFERRKSPDVLEEEIAIDIAAGIAYRFVPNWFIGAEWRMQSDYLNPQESGEFNPELKRSSFDLTDFRVGSRHQYGHYLGPTIHYGAQNWYFTGGVLWQVKGGGSQFSYSKNGKNWDEHEKLHAGVTVAYSF